MSNCGDGVGVLAFVLLFAVGGVFVMVHVLASLFRVSRTLLARPPRTTLPRAQVRR